MGKIKQIVFSLFVLFMVLLLVSCAAERGVAGVKPKEVPTSEPQVNTDTESSIPSSTSDSTTEKSAEQTNTANEKAQEPVVLDSEEAVIAQLEKEMS